MISCSVKKWTLHRILVTSCLNLTVACESSLYRTSIRHLSVFLNHSGYQIKSAPIAGRVTIDSISLIEDRCCHYIKPLKRMYFVDPVRQCYDCAVVSTAENDFYEKSIHSLFAGTIMCLRNSCNINENVLCQLSSDHRFLRFKSQKAHGTSTSQMLSCPSSIMLDRISAVKFVTNPEGILNGINIEYSEDSSSPRITKLLELHTIESKLSISFMAALQKAIRLMFQSRSCL